MRSRSALAAICLAAACSAEPVAVSPPRPPSDAPPLTWPELRLPATVRPQRYELDLTIIPSEPSFAGSISIDVTLAEPSRVIFLNGTSLTVHDAAVIAGRELHRAKVTAAPEDFIALHFDAPVPAGPARIQIAYQGLIDGERSRGIYREREGEEGETYAYTFFEPIDARRAFPCFDEPSAKVPWNITLHVKKDHVALANSPVIAERDEQAGMKAVTFAESRPMPSYLVAFVVGPFDVIPAGTAGHYQTKLRFVVPRGRGSETRYAAEVTPRIIGLLERYFDMPYPFGKLDVAVVPRFWGTMEHPGLVALGQPLTLIKPGEDSEDRRRRYANIAIHELSHYWFGDYVTNAWWDETWLNEALATWLDIKLTDQLEPSWRFAESARHAGGAMTADARESAKRIRQPIKTKSDIEDSFDGELTYEKGSAVLTMFERWLGPEVFQRGIRRFVREHAWGNAVADDLLRALSAESGRDIGPAFKTFLDQPGVPIVSAEPICGISGARLRLSQKRFVPKGSAIQASSLWQIPVCLKHGAGARVATTCALLDQPSREIPIEGPCPEWVMLDDSATGYYRGDYSPAALRALATKAKGALSPAERASILDDAAALTRTGAVPLGDALALLPVLADGSDRVTFVRGAAILEAARADLLPVDLRGRFARFLQSTYGARARALGFTPRAGEGAEDHALRPALLALLTGPGQDQRLREEARDRVSRWLDDRASLAPDLVEIALGAAGRTNDKALFARLHAALLAEQDHRARAALAAALGGFTDPALLDKALALVVEGPLDLRDSVGILVRATGAPESRARAFAFLRDHFDALATKMRADEAAQLFREPTVICDEQRRAELAAFYGPRAEKIDSAPRVLAAALEEMRICAASAALNRESLTNFLSGY